MHWRSGFLLHQKQSALRRFFLSELSSALTLASPQSATAQKHRKISASRTSLLAMLEHMQKMRRYKDPDRGAQHTPRVIDRFSVDSDPNGAIASFQPNGATDHLEQCLLQGYAGTNGRTCFTLPSAAERLGCERRTM